LVIQSSNYLIILFLRSIPIQPVERNPRFTNPLAGSTSPYLRQHAHNPVFWYPWGSQALERARVESKPILLSIGYSTCYWCHVMEREVFENLSIASLMNRHFINIKIDREEHPELDEIYMVARQLMTHEGGWPNNVFLTPDLKPFYAGGTYAADESYGKPAFPRLLEWLNHAWTAQESDVRKTADKITEAMQPYLVFSPSLTLPREEAGEGKESPLSPQGGGLGRGQAQQLFALMKEHHDGRSGGFFQAPKFPHECYLSFLLGFYEHTQTIEALDMITRSLQKMAAGGIYDHVACGFHRYAVDKEWYVPHFEKMLYNQAQLARVYTDAARLTGNEYFADIAKSILDFVSGPFTDGNGAFYAAFDAETDGVEGAYYAWTAEELQEVLTPEEVRFFTVFYALADIPKFPGHKHTDGQAIIARKPLDLAAREQNMPYVQLAAMTGQVMNKLLTVRNKRKAPHLDDKIIVSWNGLMIDAFAHAGKIFGKPEYVARARKAADFLLEHAIDNEGSLKRIVVGGRAQIDAMLEDYAFLIKGLITLWRAGSEDNLLDAAKSLAVRAEELFADNAGGYFAAQASQYLLMRIKNGEDSATPNANAVMLHNLLDLFEITKDGAYRDKAQALANYFLNGQTRALVEWATMTHAAMRLEPSPFPSPYKGEGKRSEAELGEGVADNAVTLTAALFPADAKPGDHCELIVTLEIKDGWHINAHRVNAPFLIPTQIEVQGKGVELLDVLYPEGLRKNGAEGESLLVYEGLVNVTARLKLAKNSKHRPPIKAMIRFQPCHGATCHKVRDVSLTV